ncbi:MAG: hypothetical protein M3391_02955, partial [Actinomycetota bacterium]|nr:hypothetical protein [Actinomycetota bacterium]
LGDDRARAAGLLAALAGRANETLDALRDLARGIFPPLLADKGIASALEAHIRKHELDVVLSVDESVSGARFEERVEIAVYFCCLEALSARRDGTTISLVARDGSVEMSCTAVMLDGARLESIRDRVEALSGMVELEDHGESSALRASFPVAMLAVAR